MAITIKSNVPNNDSALISDLDTGDYFWIYADVEEMEIEERTLYRLDATGTGKNAMCAVIVFCEDPDAEGYSDEVNAELLSGKTKVMLVPYRVTVGYDIEVEYSMGDSNYD